MSKRRAELRAYRLLAECGVTQAPVNLERLADYLGATIQREMIEDDVSGMVFKHKGRYIIGINDRHPETRKNFTIAHEMGHIVLHQLDQVHVDKKFPVKLRDDVSSQAIDPHEIEANAFAAALLMPEALLKKDLSEIDCENEDQRNDLAEKYGVSRQAMNYRLMNLGFLTFV
ncbi:MAG: ImmA/IrrE family metallo-endopeptidase [Nitrospira sp.]|nr:ImmA/IrrE family metallo-endopeptidase [Nitrospira sp.]